MTATALIDIDRLAAWLDQVGLAAGEPTTVEPMSGGASNEMFAVTRGGARWVLRRPANVAVDRADAGMVREYRILRALRGSEVPHAQAVALCEDHSVLGRTFFLMGHVDGRPPTRMPPEFDNPSGRAAIIEAVVDALARLHEFKWQDSELSDLGRPADFHERQVERWTRQLRSYEGRELPGIASITDWLRSHLPRAFTPALMHGDYHAFNLLATFERRPRVSAIVDWETATIGDPLLDLAGLCEAWTRDAGPGWPLVDDMVEIYRRARNLPDVGDLTYYQVLYNFRLAVLLEGVYQRARRDRLRVEQPEIGEFVLSNVSRAMSLIGE
jgi:aminoglycoside phosphotransferase (APT) family kinase protein